MAYPSKPTGTNILPFDTVFAINSDKKQPMTAGEILDGYNNDGETETDLTSRPDANKFNMFWYQVHNTIKWVVAYIEELYNSKLEKSGGNITGIINMGQNKITADYTPSRDNDLTNKSYVDKAMNSAMWVGEVKMLAYPVVPQLSNGVEVMPCDGRALSRAEYPELFMRIGGIFGAGDGYSTFNIPDYRGVFLRGWDGGSNRDYGRVYGQMQFSGVPNIWGNVRVPQDKTRGLQFANGCFWNALADNNGFVEPEPNPWFGSYDVHFNASRVSGVYQDGLQEARPINANCYYIIRVK